MLLSITIEEQIQQVPNDQLHCRVCNLDISTEGYADHLKTVEHQEKYFAEIDMEDGIPIVIKLDSMFEDMHTLVNKRFEKIKLEKQI